MRIFVSVTPVRSTGPPGAGAGTAPGEAEGLPPPESEPAAPPDAAALLRVAGDALLTAPPLLLPDFEPVRAAVGAGVPAVPGVELDPEAAGEPAAGVVAGVPAVPAVSEPGAAPASEPPAVAVPDCGWPAAGGAAALSLTPAFCPQAAATRRTSRRAAQRM